MTTKQTAVAAAAGFAVLCAGAVVAAPAQASHGGGDAVRTSGACSNGPGVWKLKGKADNGDVVVNRDVTTKAPSGSFTVHARPTNRAGVTDTIRAHAVRGDRVCGGMVQV